MLNQILQFIVMIAGIVVGTAWVRKKRSALPLPRLISYVGRATAALCILAVVTTRVDSEWLEVACIVLAWQIAGWYWVVLWRQIVNKEGQALTNERACSPKRSGPV